jgi:peptidoglycan LD-endopeptidase CwlK
MFKLGKTSKSRLEGLDGSLIRAVSYAINITTVDFFVVEGVRTLEKQKENVATGASQTLNSKHLTGHAVDIAAYVERKAVWEGLNMLTVCESMRKGFQHLEVSARWGGAWHIPDITKYEGTLEEANLEYVNLRLSQGRKPFIDLPHWELIT